MQPVHRENTEKNILHNLYTSLSYHHINQDILCLPTKSGGIIFHHILTIQSLTKYFLLKTVTYHDIVIHIIALCDDSD